MRILFLNQFFPPDPAPTGILLHELGMELQAAGHEVEFIAAGQEYRTGRKGRGRLAREARALGSIFHKALGAKRPDVVFSCSSPPCLLLIATMVARYHRARSVHWGMDLYPELASSLGEIGPGLEKAVGKCMGYGYRKTAILVGLDGDMTRQFAKYGASATAAIRPWVPAPLLGIQDAPAEQVPVWLYSGNLGRAHEWKTLLDAQAEIERRGSGITLRFQGGGASWPEAQAYAKALGLQRCEWNGYVPEEELRESLLRARVLVFTQRPETQGLLWPSKLATLLDLHRPILFVGPESGAIAETLRNHPIQATFPPGASSAIADWVANTMQASTSLVNWQVDEAREYRRRALAEWLELLSQVAHQHSR